MTGCGGVQRLDDWSSLIAQSSKTISPFNERQSVTEPTVIVQLLESGGGADFTGHVVSFQFVGTKNG